MERHTEKRKSKRVALRYPAWIERSGGYLVDCGVSDISVSGAKISLDDDANIPDHFILFLSSVRLKLE